MEGRGLILAAIVKGFNANKQYEILIVLFCTTIEFIHSEKISHVLNAFSSFPKPLCTKVLLNFQNVYNSFEKTSCMNVKTLQ